MKYALSFTTLLASAALAEKVDIIWRHEKATEQTSISVLDTATREVLAESCGSKLTANAAVDFSSVNEHGAGSFSVGNNSFDVVSAALAGGDAPDCTRMSDPQVALVDCSGIEWSAAGFEASDDSCHTADEAKEALAMFQEHRPMSKRSIPAARDAISSPNVAARRSVLSKRQGTGTCQNTQITREHDNPDPHQNYLHQQLSENIDCASAASCSVGQTESISYDVGFSFGGDPTGAGWISSGFSVSKTWSTGNAYTCNANKGEQVCIWYKTAHTAYWIVDEHFVCPGKINKYDVLLKSPNERNSGGGYYCVVGSCRSQGEHYWDDSGRAGGP